MVWFLGFSWDFETRFYSVEWNRLAWNSCIAQAGVELRVILLPQLSYYWSYRHVPLPPAGL